MQLTTWKKNNRGCVGNSFNFFLYYFDRGLQFLFVFIYIYFLAVFLKGSSGLTGEGPTLHRIRSAGGVAAIVDREGGREGDTLLSSIFFSSTF